MELLPDAANLLLRYGAGARLGLIARAAAGQSKAQLKLAVVHRH